MHDRTFESLYREELAELYDAERQMIEEMPRLIRAASTEELKGALELHVAETKEQAGRLGTILANIGGPPPRAISDAMRALLAKGRMLTLRLEPSAVLDASIIMVARQIEHYEIAAYGNARQLARMLGHDFAAAVLNKTLKEEQDTSADLAQIAESIIMGEELEDAVLEEPTPA